MGCCCTKSTTVAPGSQEKYAAIAELVKPTTPKVRKPPDNRFTKIGISTVDPSLLIQGYENEPLCSLEEALQRFHGRIPELTEKIAEAKSKCHHPSPHGLTRDESAAIYLYSMRDGGGNSVYDHLQRAWATNDRSQMQPWLKYLKLIKTGLDKLPDVPIEAWQGSQYNPQLENILQRNGGTLYTTMSSGATGIQTVKQVLNPQPGSRTVYTGFRSVHGKDVSDYTEQRSGEIWLWPGTKITQLQGPAYGDDGSVIYHFGGSPKVLSPEPIKPIILPTSQKSTSDTPREKHFVCPITTCGNRCRGVHDPKHCYGFSTLAHKCSHHCGPLSTCYKCDQHGPALFQCTKCEERFCEKCSFK